MAKIRKGASVVADAASITPETGSTPGLNPEASDTVIVNRGKRKTATELPSPEHKRWRTESPSGDSVSTTQTHLESCVSENHKGGGGDDAMLMPPPRLAVVSGGLRGGADPSPAPPAAAEERSIRKNISTKKRKNPNGPNVRPEKPLDIFVFGEGGSGELGLGNMSHAGRMPINVTRPRLNHNLDSVDKEIIQVACGGMHAVALDSTGRIYTWGVNDDKALGRDTTWPEGRRDIDFVNEDPDDSGLNPFESTPTEINYGEISHEDIITQVAATDSASFALTDDGFVFGWGTFRGTDGIIGFDQEHRIMPTPVWYNELQDIKKIVGGSNHVLALDKEGRVWSWGSGSQFQLGRKPVARTGGVKSGLRPQQVGKFGKKHRAIDIAAGSYHSFYIDNLQRVWSWGLNNYSQTGHDDKAGGEDAMILNPTLINSLSNQKIRMVAGGEHHTIACTEDGVVFTWGRIDGHQVGHLDDVFTKVNTIWDESENPRILREPTILRGVPPAKFVAAGTDTSFAISKTGRAYSWGFSANHQAGLHTTLDVVAPTLIDNSAVRGRRLVWAGAGGQYSMLAAVRDDPVTPPPRRTSGEDDGPSGPHLL
ncbi:RCC1/BLIP-II [Xylariaceae sp. FL0804]|nr:RCC1/BLIP-II [Xylariaceae sp. FL0804]